VPRPQERLWTPNACPSSAIHGLGGHGLLAYPEAHAEDVEDGVHRFHILDQLGCKVHQVGVDGEWMPELGPHTATVLVKPGSKRGTIFVHVYCLPNP
jgi:hypothetical protein